ncbi:hypothetical protein DdX_20923 [Ditylenchus destructor]|uniref:Uncharacterized protein n=1 Tax=Ditylenchus destructor TaxID=166010 RepID=A0AAD4MJX6_9BILA|nr:hypothetical protein DdX_20923 [Ditylenchus destructor]
MRASRNAISEWRLAFRIALVWIQATIRQNGGVDCWSHASETQELNSETQKFETQYRVMQQAYTDALSFSHQKNQTISFGIAVVVDCARVAFLAESNFFIFASSAARDS